MITLTLPPEVVAELGGATTISYDKVVVEPKILPTSQSIELTLILTSSTDVNAQPIRGFGVASLQGNPSIEIRVQQLNFHRRVNLGGAAVTALQNLVDAAQNSVEQGLIDINLIEGTQAPGV